MKRLFTPGPTEVPPRVLQAMAKPLIHHRTAAFRDLHRRVIDGLQRVFKTANPIIVLTSSGTGAMEAAVANITLPGDTVLVASCGKFSERWGAIARSFGLKVIAAEAEWGSPVSPAEVAEALEKHPGVSCVFMTHVETSTGVRMDVERIARTAGEHGAIAVADCISSLCAENVETDAWHIDAVIGGSQKGFGAPPGLAFISLGERAIERVRAKGHPVYYFDLGTALDALERGDTSFTPATSIVAALAESLDLIVSEGLDAVIARHERNAKAVRAAVEELGLTLFSRAPCNATTPVLPPAGTAQAIAARMDERYGVRIAGGQGKLKGTILRLGHLGFYDEADMRTMISALEGALRDLGIAYPPGAGVAALTKSFDGR
jgi:aspartate aminotransferase-like enzyme